MNDTTPTLSGQQADTAAPRGAVRASWRRLAGVALAVLGTAALLALTTGIGQQRAESIGRYFVYQGAGLAVAALVVVGVGLLNGRAHLRWGSLAAPSRQVRALGTKAGESWRRIGITFTLIISAVTGLFLFIAYRDQLGGIAPASWLLALAIAIPLSATNSLTEELITRWAVVESLPGSWARVAPWASAAIFGGVHVFGIPGGPTGALMAGFLGWLLARSIQDTRGIGWAWIVHFCQDILIFTVTLVLFV
ncbi:MAG: CPBP family intramembrane metalloprotease [Actinobacteria bacterium]|nr:CPBP family intramembrane metalloprotease [Actinomycetota bacterium]